MQKHFVLLLFIITIYYCTNQKNQKIFNLSNEDSTEIMQKIIDLPDLEYYYHVEILNTRKPLVILKNNIIQNEYSLKKFNERVIFLTLTEIMAQKKDAYLEFSNFNISHDSVKVSFKYRCEGVGGYAIFMKKNSNTWNVINSFAHEY